MSTESGGGEHQRWFPLESNPALMNDYVDKLGFDVQASGHEFVDVFSTEEWALDMIPQPVAAVLVLYPLTDPQLAHGDGDREIQADKVPEVWFMKQRIGTFVGRSAGKHTHTRSWARTAAAPKAGVYSDVHYRQTRSLTHIRSQICPHRTVCRQRLRNDRAAPHAHELAGPRPDLPGRVVAGHL